MDVNVSLCLVLDSPLSHVSLPVCLYLFSCTALLKLKCMVTFMLDKGGLYINRGGYALCSSLYVCVECLGSSRLCSFAQ